MTHPLKLYRLKSRITLADLAAKVGCSKSALSRIENLKAYPSHKLMSRLLMIAEGALRHEDFFPTLQIPAASPGGLVTAPADTTGSPPTAGASPHQEAAE